MDGCNVLPETQFVGTACAWTPHGFYLWGLLTPCGAAGERPEFNIKPPLGAPLLIFPRGYLLKSFPHVDTSARQQGFEIRVFPLRGELPKAIEPHLPVCQLYRRQLGQCVDIQYCMDGEDLFEMRYQHYRLNVDNVKNVIVKFV